jgi:ATP-dependent RNA helicase CshB
LYGPDDDQKVSELEDMGIKFSPKAIKDGEIVDSYDRERRTKRKKRHDPMDPSLRGMAKKEKTKHKPGYKKRIKKAIKKDEQQKRRIEQRAQRRKNKR